MGLSVNRLKDSTAVLLLSFGRSFRQSVAALEGRAREARTKAHLQSVHGCISRHHTQEGFPASISIREISERIGLLPEELLSPLQVLMDERSILCFTMDREALLGVTRSDVLRVMKRDSDFRELYWSQLLRSPQLNQYRVRNLSCLPVGVNVEGLRFISGRISMR